MWSRYPEINEDLKNVEDYLKKSIHSKNNLLNEIVNDLADAGGKRLRPAFVIISSKFGKPDRQKVIGAAAAMEILHTATLVHDDIVDQSKLRRGKPTAHEKFGVNMALYTGDFLFTKAMLSLSKDMPVEKLELLANGIKSICEGEVYQYQNRRNANTSPMDYLKCIGRKTSVLFSVACSLGASISECTPQVAQSLSKFGYCYGMAFQIRDDLNDLQLGQEVTGKPAGQDILDGVVTLPVIYTLMKSPETRGVINDYFAGKSDLTPGEIYKIVQLVRQSGSLERSSQVLKKFVDKGIKIANSLPENEYRNVLIELISKLNADV